MRKNLCAAQFDFLEKKKKNYLRIILPLILLRILHSIYIIYQSFIIATDNIIELIYIYKIQKQQNF